MINRKEFVKIILSKNFKAFVVQVTFFSRSLMLIYLAKKAQIILLITKKVKILDKHLDFLVIFSKKKALILLELSNLNQYFIKLHKNKKPPYGLVYSLDLVKVKVLKTYIETNLANCFI